MTHRHRVSNSRVSKGKEAEKARSKGGVSPESENQPAAPVDVAAESENAIGKREPWRHVTRPQLAILMGVHADTITHWTKNEELPVVVAGGRGKESIYDVAECFTWRLNQVGKNAKEQAQTRALIASAKLNELKHQEQRGELVSRDVIVRAGQAQMKALASKIRALPRRMIQVGLIPRQREADALTFIHELQLEITGWQTLATVEKQGARSK